MGRSVCVSRRPFIICLFDVGTQLCGPQPCVLNFLVHFGEFLLNICDFCWFV